MTPHDRRIVVGLLFATLVTPASARPQTSATQERMSAPPPSHTVRSELVELDVVVSGKDGQPVSDLTAGDFRVFEDGKLQTLSHFTVERRLSATGGSQSAATTSRQSASVGSRAADEGPARPRLFILTVDDIHTGPGSIAAARRAMLRFVDEQVSPDDYVALVTTSGTLGVHQDFTRDREALRRAIERVQTRYQPVQPGGTPYLSEHQAELIDRNDVEALRLAVQEILQNEDYLGEIGAREKAHAQARRMVFEIMARTSRTLSTLEAVVRGLAPLSGRKTIVLLSDGFLIGLGAAENRAFDVRRIVDAATRAGVVLYALDTRGVVAEVPGGEASFQGPGVLTAPGVRQSLQARGREAQRQGLNALAEDTGGFLVRETNNLSGGFGRILRDSESCYRLAYVPSNPDNDGRFRRIAVRLPSRPGVKVRTRSGYFASDVRGASEAKAVDPKDRRERELASALASPFPLSGVPVRMSADFIDLPPAGPQAVVRALVDVSGVPFAQTNGRYEADLEIVGAVYDEAGRSVDEVGGEQAALSLTEMSYRRVMNEGLSIQKAVPLPPGRYQVRMAVREGARSLLGSASQWLEIPDTSGGGVTLSGVFLLADGGAGSTDLTDVQVDKRFRSGQGLHYVVHVYGQPPRGAVLQAQIWRGGKLVGVGPKHDLTSRPTASASAAAPADPGRNPPRVEAEPLATKLSERIALQGFAPGGYELRLLVNGTEGAIAAERQVSFQVD